MFFYSLPKTENPTKNLKHLFENPFMLPNLISEHYVPATKLLFNFNDKKAKTFTKQKRNYWNTHSVLQLTNNPVFGFINGPFGVCSGTAVGMIDPDLCVWY